MVQNQENLDELLKGLDELYNAMKHRLIEQHMAGKQNWKEVSIEHSAYQCVEVAKEINLNPNKDIDVANWCLIHYLRRKNNMYIILTEDQKKLFKIGTRIFAEEGIYEYFPYYVFTNNQGSSSLISPDCLPSHIVERLIKERE